MRDFSSSFFSGAPDAVVDLRLGQWFSNFIVRWNHRESLLKHKLLGPTHRLSDLVGLGGTQVFMSNKFPGDADAAGPRISLGNTG